MNISYFWCINLYPMFDRHKFFVRYEMAFSKDFKKSLEEFSIDEQIDIINSILIIMECCGHDPVDYKQIQKIHEEMLKKYRKRLTNFRNFAPTEYFSENPNTKHLDLQHDLKVPNEGEEENFFTDKERMKFLNHMERYLKNHRDSLYLQTEQVTEKKEQELSGTDKKGKKFKRERGDNSTKLTEEQTALLAYLLSRTKITLKLGKEYGSIDNKTAGEAFSMLTGFNPDNLRQSLGKEKLKQIATKKNLDVVNNALQQAINAIEQIQKSLKDP